MVRRDGSRTKQLRRLRSRLRLLGEEWGPRVRRLLERPAWRVLWPGTEPVPLENPPGAAYSPIPSPADVDAGSPIGVEDPAACAIDLRSGAQRALLAALDVRPPDGPRFARNGYYDRGDAAVYQALVRYRRPRRVVEVGAGWSTAALFDAAGADAVTLIDIDLARARDVLRPDDLARCELLEKPLQQVPLDVFARLAAGDILFVDTTHVAKYGNDVNRIIFEILPALAPGVAVHFHDVLYPFDYPEVWLRAGRVWSEAYLLRAFLQFNADFEILLWPDMLRQLGMVDDPALASWLGCQHSGSIWIQRRARSATSHAGASTTTTATPAESSGNAYGADP